MESSSCVYGTFVRVFDYGVLLTGESGSGKSEAALDLISKQHKFICDDGIKLQKDSFDAGKLVGFSHDHFPYHLSIRGIGIIDILKIFGKKYVCNESSLDLIIDLQNNKQPNDFELLGDQDEFKSILGISIPHLRIPSNPQKKLANIIETAVKNQKLKQQGHHTAKQFIKKHQELILEQ